MEHVVFENMIIEFSPSGPWKWVGFDGLVTLAAALRRLVEAGQGAAVDTDVTALASQLVGRRYAGEGFDDTPGAVTAARVEVDAPTLSRRLTLAGRPAVTTATTGTFVVTCVPSFRAGSPPVPDPQPVRQGTWAVRPPQAPRTHC